MGYPIPASALIDCFIFEFDRLINSYNGQWAEAVKQNFYLWILQWKISLIDGTTRVVSTCMIT
jgi:hypothetical protein